MWDYGDRGRVINVGSHRGNTESRCGGSLFLHPPQMSEKFEPGFGLPMIILRGKRHVFLFPPCVVHGFVHPGKICRHLRWMQAQTSVFIPAGADSSWTRTPRGASGRSIWTTALARGAKCNGFFCCGGGCGRENSAASAWRLVVSELTGATAIETNCKDWYETAQRVWHQLRVSQTCVVSYPGSAVAIPTALVSSCVKCVCPGCRLYAGRYDVKAKARLYASGWVVLACFCSPVLYFLKCHKTVHAFCVSINTLYTQCLNALFYFCCI